MNKILKDWKIVIISAPLILLVFFALRLINLDILPVFVDEAIYVRWAQVMKAESTLRFLPLSDGKQPLFMWSIIPFLKVFENPLIAGRMVSVVSGLGSLVAIFLLTDLLFNSKKAGLLASAIYTVSPFAVFFDRMSLVDSMLAMFGLWTLYFSILTAKHLRLDTAMLAGFALGGALLTKSPALFFVLLLPSTGLFLKWGKSGTERLIRLIKLVFFWGVTWSIGYALFNILRLGPNFHLMSSRNQDYVFPINHILQNPKDPFLPHFDRAIEWIRMMGPNLIVVLLIVAVILNYRKYWREVSILLAWTIIPIAIQAEFAKVFTARYILFSIPQIYILVGATIVPALSISKDSLIKRLVLPLLLVGFFTQAAWFNYQLLTDPQSAPLPRSERSGYLEEWTAGTGIREVADFIERELAANSDANIVIGTEGFFGTLPDGLQIYLQNVPRVTVVGIGLGINQVPTPLAESFEAGNTTYLLANSSRLNFDGFKTCYLRQSGGCKPAEIIEANGFTITKEFEKADRPEGIREFIQHGESDTLYLLEVVAIQPSQS